MEKTERIESIDDLPVLFPIVSPTDFVIRLRSRVVKKRTEILPSFPSHKHTPEKKKNSYLLAHKQRQIRYI